VVVTHRHADHAIDLHGLFRARWFGRRSAAPLALYAPADVLDQVTALEDGDAVTVSRVFDWHPLPAAGPGLPARPIPAGVMGTAALRPQCRGALVHTRPGGGLHRGHRARCRTF